jgi:hypothetical protein
LAETLHQLEAKLCDWLENGLEHDEGVDEADDARDADGEDDADESEDDSHSCGEEEDAHNRKT